MENKNLNQADKTTFQYDFTHDQSSQPITDSILEAYSQAGIPPKKLSKKNLPSYMKKR